MQNQQQCQLCHRYNEQMLMLTCFHDPCIDCAVIVYGKQIRGKNKFNYYKCSICQQITPLDITSVLELQRQINQRKTMMTKGHNVNNNNTNAKTLKPYHSVYQTFNNNASSRKNHTPHLKQSKFDQQIQDINLLKQIQPSKPLYQLRKKTCKNHVEQQISYYCFECLDCICPQCAIHGSHQGHPVKQIKKAISQIKYEYKNMIEKIQKNQLNHKKIRQMHGKTIKQLNEKNRKQKQNISELFQKWRKEIAVKQRLILKSLDDLNMKNIQIINKRINAVNNENETGNMLIRSLNAITKKQQLKILQQYGQINNKFKSQIQRLIIDPQKQVIYGLKQKNQHQLHNILNQFIQLTQKLAFNTTQLDVNDLSYVVYTPHTQYA